MIKTRIICCLGLLILWSASLWGTSLEERLNQANASYQQGETASTVEERKRAFNRALFLYSLIEQEVDSKAPALNEALANTYFRLEEYPWAILYYQRALKENPTNASLENLLEQAQKKLGVPFHPRYSWSQMFLLEPFLSFSQRLGLFFWVAVITLLISSFTIWFPNAWIRKLAISSALILLAVLMNLLLSYYFIPLQGVIITSTGLYREPNESLPQSGIHLLLAGSTVNVLQTTSQGDWLKVEDPTGGGGYVPAIKIRLI